MASDILSAKPCCTHADVAAHGDMGLIVREIRQAKGLSQMELAARAGVRQGTISTLETTGRGQLDTLMRVADALNVSVIDLFSPDERDPTLAEVVGCASQLPQADLHRLLEFARALARTGS